MEGKGRRGRGGEGREERWGRGGWWRGGWGGEGILLRNSFRGLVTPLDLRLVM